MNYVCEEVDNGRWSRQKISKNDTFKTYIYVARCVHSNSSWDDPDQYSILSEWSSTITLRFNHFKRCSNWTSLYNVQRLYRCGKEKTGHFLRKYYLQNTLLFHILLHKAVCCCLSWNQINVHIFQTQQGPPKILINKLWSHWNDLNKIIMQC